MFSYEEAPEEALGAEEPGLQGLIQNDKSDNFLSGVKALIWGSQKRVSLGYIMMNFETFCNGLE